MNNMARNHRYAQALPTLKLGQCPLAAAYVAYSRLSSFMPYLQAPNRLRDLQPGSASKGFHLNIRCEQLPRVANAWGWSQARTVPLSMYVSTALHYKFTNCALA